MRMVASVEQPEVPGDRQEGEARSAVQRTGRCVPWVAAGLDHRNVHATTSHVLRGELREACTDASLW